jgi:hypothetical protein
MLALRAYPNWGGGRYHQDNFAPSLKPQAGLIQVTLPTEQENLASGACMRHVYESFGLSFAHIPVAAAA